MSVSAKSVGRTVAIAGGVVALLLLVALVGMAALVFFG